MSFVACFFLFLSVASLAYLIVPAWDEIAGRYVDDLTPRLVALDVDKQQVLNLMRWWGIGLFAVLFFVGVIWGKFIIAAGIFLILFSIPRMILDQQIENRRIKIRDQLVSASIGLANATRAGLSLSDGIENVARDVPAPLGKEFKRISFNNKKGGQPLHQAIREVKQRLDIESFNIFSSSVLVALERGGNISQALDKISGGLAELQRLERKIESSSAGGRRLALVLGLFPPGFLLGFYVLDPNSVGLLFETILGQIVLLVIGFLVFFAMRWCIHILDIDV